MQWLKERWKVAKKELKRKLIQPNTIHMYGTTIEKAYMHDKETTGTHKDD